MTSFLMSKLPQSLPAWAPPLGWNLAADIGLNRFLVDADVVPPGADKGHVGPGDGGHAAVGAAVELELEFVREGRAVQLVLVVIGQL